ncbi:MAG: hypothetical protein QXE96_04240 [Candidatus Caldarchaeum sp.]
MKKLYTIEAKPLRRMRRTVFGILLIAADLASLFLVVYFAIV